MMTSPLADPAPASPRPPEAARQPQTRTVHGVPLVDDYGWLRDPAYPTVADAAILDHLAAENQWFEAWMAPHRALVGAITAEMRARIREDDKSVPVRDGEHLYWRAFEAGGQYRLWWRRPAGAAPGDADQLILNEPELAEGKPYFRLGSAAISEDGTRLAYAIDDDGSERFTLYVRDLKTGALLPDVITGTLGAIVWSACGTGFFYTPVNTQWRCDRVMFHQLGAAVETDRCVYEEADPGFQVGVGCTQSRALILISTGDHNSNEVRFLPAGTPDAVPCLIAARRPDVEYAVEEHDGTLFITTNDTDLNFRLVTAPLADPGTWTEYLPPRPDFYLTDVTCFADFFVAEGRERGLDQIEVYDYAPPGAGAGETPPHRLSFPEASYCAGLGENPEYAVDRLRISYESMVTPGSVLEWTRATDQFVTLKVQDIPSGYDASGYRTERLEIPARDGVLVPVSIVMPHDFPLDGTRPLYLYGYGAYGLAIEPGFDTARLSLLDRGFAYAIAHIRGGDDLGQQWYRDGKLTKRWNAFNDFVDVARGLIARGYSAEGRICAAGGSAGGELMGVVVNTDPGLWAAVAAHVPFVDVLNTMLDDSLPLTPGEWPEWGNPITDEAAFALIRSYSPYDNGTAQAYPPLFVTAGLSDPRVTYWEPAKWVARLRATATGDAPLILKTHMDAGHGGKSGRFDSLTEVAEEFAFFLEATAKPPAKSAAGPTGGPSAA